MIYRPRISEACPASLDLADTSSPGAKELGRLEKWIAGKRIAPRPAFTAYKSKDVAPALERLFEGKCAYCESLYAPTHPVDVEHWRPKAEVEIDGQPAPRHGYEWLAMDWRNLLPSCIDCNRARFHLVPDARLGWKQVKQGKANQFPIADETARLTSRLPPQAEEPLLVDPCTDNPADYFEFSSQGVVLPRAGLDKDTLLRATESIRVYALNRKGLVDERLRHLAWLKAELCLVRFLYQASGDYSLPAFFQRAAETLVIEALERLRQKSLAATPYSQFITQAVQTFLKDELGM